MSRARPAVSVAILTRNRLPKLETFLAAILPQLADGDQLIILDTGSTDGTRDYLQTLPENATVLHREPTADFAAARNHLIEAAANPLIVFTDDDCYPAPDWLEKLVATVQSKSASGGACLPARLYEYPWWWTPGMAWTVGFSTDGFLRSDPVHYPATSNLAASRSLFEEFRFSETPHRMGEATAYYGGREDTTWWRSIRVAGVPTTAEPRAIVFHDIPADRVSLRYVLSRVQADGVAWWERDGTAEHARNLPTALARAYIHLWKNVLRRNGQQSAYEFLWLQRTLAAWHAARRSADQETHRHVSLPATASALKDETRRSLARSTYSAVRRVRPKQTWPPPVPARVYVAAQGFVGDTVLLRPLIKLLATNFPFCEVLVDARHTQLLGGLPGNVKLVTCQSDDVGAVDAAIIPYYVFGDAKLWKWKLSKVAATFNWDVGFARDRYYRLARQTVPKDASQHELHNLLNLFSIWPLTGPLEPPTLPTPTEDVQGLMARFPKWRDSPPITIQLGTGHPSKTWSTGRFAQLIDKLCADNPRLPIALLGDNNQFSVAQEVCEQGGAGVTNLCGCTLSEMIATLSLSRYHIGGCSAPMQIASALGTPTFTLYGSTEPERWGALFHKDRHSFVRAVPAPLTWGEFQSLPPRHLMNLIQVDTVYAGILEHMARLGVMSGN